MQFVFRGARVRQLGKHTSIEGVTSGGILRQYNFVGRKVVQRNGVISICYSCGVCNVLEGSCTNLRHGGD